jgi:hypothetical protein
MCDQGAGREGGRAHELDTGGRSKVGCTASWQELGEEGAGEGQGHAKGSPGCVGRSGHLQ